MPSSPCWGLSPHATSSIRQLSVAIDIVQLRSFPTRRRLLASRASWERSMRATICMGHLNTVACSRFPADARAFPPLVCLLVDPVLYALLIISLTDGSTPRIQNTKRNMKAFGSCANAPAAALWYDKQFPPFINYDQESAWPCFICFSCPVSLLSL